MIPSLFFGYSSKPDFLRASMHEACKQIGELEQVTAGSWEELAIQGRLVINTILSAIDRADLCVFDVSTLNQNVLFELGYALARGKRLWITLNSSLPEAHTNWRNFYLLSQAGYFDYVTANDLQIAFLSKSPHYATKTLWDDLSEALEPQDTHALFYVPPYNNSDASRALSRQIDKERSSGIRVVSADPTEHGSAPLSWYIEQVYGTSGSLIHLIGDAHPRALLHNARCALIAGIARGLGRKLLMVADETHREAFDYADLLYKFPNRKKLGERFTSWMRTTFPVDRAENVQRDVRNLRLATELKSLRFGDYVAENEAEELDEYFVETAQYGMTLAGQSLLFVGRKGVGKTANMLRAAEELKGDKRNLVCVIKPSSYELEGLVSVLRQLGDSSAQSFLIESLWQFLLYSEIAVAAVQTAERMPAGIASGTAMSNLRTYVDRDDLALREEFSVRLERVIRSAQRETAGDFGGLDLSEQRTKIGTALHRAQIAELRKLIGEAASDRDRVAILVDNLDKAWTKTSDLALLSSLILGLLSAVGRVADDFRKDKPWKASINVTLAVFLRADIYSHVMLNAREPDKISVAQIDWSQQELLMSVIEQRYLAVRPPGTDQNELWTLFFNHPVRGMPAKKYISSRILQRPRDLVFICNEAVRHAINGRRESIEEHDILAAEKIYSKFAFDALLVENGITISQLELILFEFLGSPAILDLPEVLHNIEAANTSSKTSQEILDHLVYLSFLGIETKEEFFEYPDSKEALTRANRLARRLGEIRNKVARYSVHPAYRAYLDVEEAALQ